VEARRLEPAQGRAGQWEDTPADTGSSSHWPVTLALYAHRHGTQANS
jgi:hypothetical protein